ncbi:MAG: VTT domain-containing protein [Thermoanaerobaculia bacterium]|nr:VTT domain-containing protein [Thermoanaerobaculia bacterium]MCZ7652844.1 VTT domain-containing protein [Thermoanaerobaculia bacterium]
MPRSTALLLAAALAALGTAALLGRAGLLDWRLGLALAEGHAGAWWLPPALALVTAALFAASLPGSLAIWVGSLLLPPALAAPAFVAGAVTGSFGAYRLAHLARGSGRGTASSRRLRRLLARRSDFTTLLALRMAPGVPHSAINLGAGLLGIPLGRFLAASALGLGVKGTLYAVAIHRAARLAAVEEALSWPTLAPLAGLALLLLLAPPLARRVRDRRPPPAEPPLEAA